MHRIHNFCNFQDYMLNFQIKKLMAQNLFTVSYNSRDLVIQFFIFLSRFYCTTFLANSLLNLELAQWKWNVNCVSLHLCESWYFVLYSMSITVQEMSNCFRCSHHLYVCAFRQLELMCLFLCSSEVILTLGSSRTVTEFLFAAKEKKRSFRVYVAEGAPRFNY